ncbi:Protein-lysine N-methyltransferase efm4 [Knufia obscura]|uniref:Protein-lysine N-methyltransferase EFM4 n=1 Tax=Knufia obscura TaxID=1635080 RepID=A0ABR0RWN8_9EURO|nr:Protein-lysine N-methyltransferase efm4 [Knufia obscura]
MTGVSPNSQVKHLRPSELGTRDWDKSYQNDLENGFGEEEGADLTQLESWFDEVDAPQKVLEYLTSEDFPLSPTNPERTIEKPKVLDLGCGNGSSLFQLKLDGGYQGPMLGVDYSQQSVNLAQRLWKKHIDQQSEAGELEGGISFEQFDLLKDLPTEQSWWPEGGFDLVLDKGTFDAISLSGETMELDGQAVRIVEAYPRKVAQMIRPGGYLLITSCNWTEEEVVRWFTQRAEVKELLKEYGRVKYPVYEFGGRKGQGVASVCFQRVAS